MLEGAREKSQTVLNVGVANNKIEAMGR